MSETHTGQQPSALPEKEAESVPQQEVPMRRWSFFVYGVFCHLLFLATYAYMAGFVGNLWVPKSLDSAPANGLFAAGIDVMLIGLFGLQHSIMARPWFKRIWTRLVPQPIERSTYVLISCVAVFLLMWQWRGLDAIIWNVEHPVGRGLLWALFAAGWLMVPAVSLMINHFDLFGTRQVWLYLRGRPYVSLPFRTPLLYNRMPTSALRRLGRGVLGDADHDAGPLALCRRNDALRGRRRPLRGTRSGGPLRRHLSRVPAARPCVRPLDLVRARGPRPCFPQLLRLRRARAAFARALVDPVWSSERERASSAKSPPRSPATLAHLSPSW